MFLFLFLLYGRFLIINNAKTMTIMIATIPVTTVDVVAKFYSTVADGADVVTGEFA